MKLSELKKQMAKKYPHQKLYTMSLDELFSITEFDVQPERSKREDGLRKKIKKCKHTDTYTLLLPSETTHKEFEKSKELGTITRDLIESCVGTEEVSYYDLDEVHKKAIDDGWESFDPMRCSELHGDMES